jgi:hypothetical protein
MCAEEVILREVIAKQEKRDAHGLLWRVIVGVGYGLGAVPGLFISQGIPHAYLFIFAHKSQQVKCFCSKCNQAIAFVDVQSDNRNHWGRPPIFPRGAIVIDIQNEELFSLAEIAKSLPTRRAGKRPNIATLYRWTNEGCKGIRLEYSMIGATRCTSREALQRFFDALTARVEDQRATIPTIPPQRVPAHRRKAIEAAERKLAAAGI